MKNYSQLQEECETRNYILKNTVTGNLINVKEYFYYYQKRGNIFPSQFSRQGRQYVEILDKNCDFTYFKVFFRNVGESSSARKYSIFKFLRQHVKDLRNYECLLKDKVAKLECFEDCLELVRSVLPLHTIEEANEKELGFVEIIYEGLLSIKLTERVTNAIKGKCITYKIIEDDEKVLTKIYIKYLS